MRARLVVELALAGAVLAAGGLGCDSRVLGGIVTANPDAGMDASAGTSGGAGTGGTGGEGGRGGSAGTGGSISGGGSTGTGGGSCPLTCGAVACPVLPGQPRVVVTSPYDKQIMALAVTADTIFWGTYPNQTQGEIRSMPLAGGPSTLLAQNVIVTELYLDGATLYYVSSDRSGSTSLFAVPATGGTARTLATGSEIRSITSDASGVYFGQKTATGATNSRIMRVDRAGSAPTLVMEITGTLWGFALDQTDIYWAVYANGGALYRRALAGGNTTTLRVSSSPITHPIVDGDEIDFVEGINTPDTCQSAVWSVAKAGGTPSLVSPGTSGTDVWGPVRDSTRLYWSRASRQGAVLRTVKGQTPEVLTTDQSNISPLVVGPSDIYWIVGSSSGYEVRTLPK